MHGTRRHIGGNEAEANACEGYARHGIGAHQTEGAGNLLIFRWKVDVTLELELFRIHIGDVGAVKPHGEEERIVVCGRVLDPLDGSES